MSRKLKATQGSALLEMALALIVIALVYVAALPWMTRQQDAVAAKSLSNDHTQFAAAASAYFQSNRAAYLAAMKDGTGADKLCLVRVNPVSGTGVPTYNANLHRCAFDASFLKYQSALPITAGATNSYGEKWVAIFKAVYDRDTPPKPTGGVEMMVVSANLDGGPAAPAAASSYDRALTGAGFLEGNGGVVPDADRSTCVASRAAGKYEACGSGWRVNLADFLAADELTMFTNRLSN